jgi:hypothetical protein
LRGVGGVFFLNPTKTKKNYKKKHSFTVSRKIPKTKEITFEKDIINQCLFISIFGINLYI